MARARSQLRVIVESASDLQPLGPETADELVELLKTDTVSRWAEEVNAAIRASRALSNPLSQAKPTPENHSARSLDTRRENLRRQILQLEKQLGNWRAQYERRYRTIAAASEAA